MKKELYERYKNLKESLEELAKHQANKELKLMILNNDKLYQKAYAETFFRGLLLNISGTGLYTVHLLHQYRKVELLLEQGISNIAFYDTLDQKSIFLILLGGAFITKAVRDFVDLNCYQKDIERTKKKIL